LIVSALVSALAFYYFNPPRQIMRQPALYGGIVSPDE